MDDIYGPKVQENETGVPGFDRGIKCAHCGKIFYILCMKNWVYKNSFPAVGHAPKTTRYFCTWSCLRAWEKKHLPPVELEEGLY